jgi:hypothetical protein
VFQFCGKSLKVDNGIKLISMKYLILAFSSFFMILPSVNAQITNIVILDSTEITNLRVILNHNSPAKNLYDSNLRIATESLKRIPQPVEEIHYEGLLENNPKRIKTTQSLKDIDAAVSLIYAGYGTEDEIFGKKVKDFIWAWVNTFQPDGNPINENKLDALFWGYYLMQKHFDKNERETVEKWMLEIAEKEMHREQTPNNNWEAKRLKIIGTIGCILQNEELKNYSAKGFMKYIETAYFADGTSNDLLTRDALHYHISGLTPCISSFINLSKFDNRFDLFEFVSESGSSIKKSVEYVLPFATGEKQREEWTNSKVQLDKERAAAGFEEYRPGKIFEPQKAFPMFEWACYYNPDWYSIFEERKTEKYTNTWIGLLNSPLVRR